MRRSIRSRLAFSHAAAVTASTFVYASGGFVLLIVLLVVFGSYTVDGLVRLVPQFMGVTIFVLVQIALITLCGIVVARIAATMVSRTMLRQIEALEEGSEAIARGELERQVAVLSDDELGRLATRFNDLSARLGAADRRRRAFVANVSHDLRTPIAVIRGHVETQLRTEPADDLPPRASFAVIAKEVETLSRLIDDLFTVSRLEEGVLPVATAEVDMLRLAEDSVAAVRPYALKNARVSVNLQAPDALPPVVGDATRITQVVNNLLHNAVRHTPEGGLVLLRLEPDQSGAWMHVTVQDTGVGIPQDKLHRIFDRYYRGEAIGEKGGAGLGLSIVKQLVEMQGGKVWASSTVGEGTAITFSLPLVLASPQS